MKAKGATEVAEEAARLLYYGCVEDYKRAKTVACSNLGLKILPNNFDVAMKVNALADKIEGKLRSELLIDLRKKALLIMNELAVFNPKLVGSVWRGTSRKGSDIDITVYSENIDAVINLIKSHYDNVRSEYTAKTSGGVTTRFFHIYLKPYPSCNVEVVVRSPEEINKRHRCEIYGDYITGLTRDQLCKLLENGPLKKMIPKKKMVFRNR